MFHLEGHIRWVAKFYVPYFVDYKLPYIYTIGEWLIWFSLFLWLLNGVSYLLYKVDQINIATCIFKDSNIVCYYSNDTGNLPSHWHKYMYDQGLWFDL